MAVIPIRADHVLRAGRPRRERESITESQDLLPPVGALSSALGFELKERDYFVVHRAAGLTRPTNESGVEICGNVAHGEGRHRRES